MTPFRRGDPRDRAQAREVSAPQVALAWLLGRPAVSSPTTSPRRN